MKQMRWLGKSTIIKNESLTECKCVNGKVEHNGQWMDFLVIIILCIDWIKFQEIFISFNLIYYKKLLQLQQSHGSDLNDFYFCKEHWLIFKWSRFCVHNMIKQKKMLPFLSVIENNNRDTRSFKITSTIRSKSNIWNEWRLYAAFF